MFPLKLEYQKSKINNILCYETIDEGILNKLINSKLLNEIKWDNGCYQNEKQQLKAYKKSSSVNVENLRPQSHCGLLYYVFIAIK